MLKLADLTSNVQNLMLYFKNQQTYICSPSFAADGKYKATASSLFNTFCSQMQQLAEVSAGYISYK